MNPTTKNILIGVGCIIVLYIILIMIKKYSTYLQWIPSPLSGEYYSHEEFKHLEEASESVRRRKQHDASPESVRHRRQEEAHESVRRRRQEEAHESVRRRQQHDSSSESVRHRRQEEEDPESRRGQHNSFNESFRRRRQDDSSHESFRRRRQDDSAHESFIHEEDVPEYFRQNVEAPDMQSVPMRPSLIPQIPPRFGQNEKNISNGQYNQDMMASPPTPLYSSIHGANYPATSPLYTIDFDKLGKQEYYADVSKRVGGGKPELQNTKDLMPVPDMRHTTGMDPTDPSNFMYNRTIFGKLKRRYGNNVDFFRGDIDIKPEYRGWYDIRPPTEADVVQGYFSKYQDVQQETDVRDSNFMRTLTPDQVNKMNSNPGGKQGFQH